MRRCVIALVMSLTCGVAFAQGQLKLPPDVQELKTQVVVLPLKLPPDMYVGEVSGVDRNSKGHLFVYTRTGNDGPARGGQAARLWEFDQTGKFVREIGKNLYGFSFAHFVRIDKDDNIWAVDEGSNMVIKFNPEGQVMMVIGRKYESVDYLEEHFERGEHVEEHPKATANSFNRPTDVAWDPAGNIYITDGYTNSRVAKVDKDGNWVKSWGSFGKEPGQFDIPHSIATDGKVLYVGDRGNRRIQVFDYDGKYIKEYPNVGGGAVCIPAVNPHNVMFVTQNSAGTILKLDLSGKILGIVARPGRGEKNAFAHMISCPSENELLAAETSTWRVKKITLLP